MSDPEDARMTGSTDGTVYEYVCACGWEGTEPTFDAHFNAWCPRCGKPADFKLPG